MKLSYEWLKEYVDIDVSADKLAHMLTMAGSAVESVKDSEHGKVLELEITSNRPDCLNMVGLARETAVIFNKRLKMPKMDKQKAAKTGIKIECAIKAKDLCPRYTARVIAGINVKESGAEIKKRISSAGLRPVNNVVDITNYCLMELGQPMHAFDLDKIKGGKVIARKASKGEKIITIDGAERTLEDDMLVIADAERAIAVAGVMGGRDTEVTAGTKNILLESAYFDPISVRRTARRLAISTDSSYRFERGVDRRMVRAASERAILMITAEAGGTVGEFYDAGKAEAPKVLLKFDVARASKVLGIPLSKAQVKRIFKGLGAEIKKENGDKLQVAAPSFRADLEREIDLVEEVARIFGYDNIPSTVSKIIPQGERKEKPRRVEEKIKTAMMGMGLNEIITYSLTNRKAAELFPSLSRTPLQLANPLSEEQRFLVPHLLDGMLKAVAWNINRKNNDLAFFEVGKTYGRTGSGAKDFIETPLLSIGLTGAVRRNWKEGEVKADLYDLKGIVESLMGRLKIKTVFESALIDEFLCAAEIRLGGENRLAGVIGELSGKALAAYDIAQPVYVCQIALDETARQAVMDDLYAAIPRFPSSSRDVSILCDKELEAANIRAAIEKLGEGIVREVELIDLYQGDKLPAGKKSLTYSIKYGRDDRTLTDEEVETANSGIRQALTERFQVTFR